MEQKNAVISRILHDLTVLYGLLNDKLIKEGFEVVADPERDMNNLMLYEGMKKGVLSCIEVVENASGIYRTHRP